MVRTSAIFAALCWSLPQFAAAAACDSIPGGTSVPATGNLPAYCQVKMTVKPVADSEIQVEIWMPDAAAWNGKFVGTGNGGYSGALSYGDMRNALQHGYATAGSNTGHAGGDLKFGVSHPEKIKDWAYRAVHVMTEKAKQVMTTYYQRAATHAYFTGCSTGGHQALMEAQRYPTDYDGIVAGDPGNDRIRLNAGFLTSWLAANKDPANPFPASKLSLLNKAAIEACDGLDGIKDGILSEPQRCQFDPAVLACKSGDGADCLTAAQVTAVKAIYGGSRVFPGWERGSESFGGRGGWTGYFVGQPEPARTDFWRYWVFDNPQWDPRTFDGERDVAAAEAKVGFIDARNPDLKPFEANKGKIVMYHGWADPVVPPEDGIQYYESVGKAMGGTAKIVSFFRLFMVPGMGHCNGGPGPNSFDALGALDQWVSAGTAPQKIIASHSTGGAVDRTRPLCPYPQVAIWNGKGSSDDAANFVCATSR
jgi:feruloyl esterase